MLATLIRSYDKNHFIFDPVQKQETDRLSDATIYDRINTIYQFIKPFLDKKKCRLLRNMEPLTKFENSIETIKRNTYLTVRITRGITLANLTR